MTAPTTRRLDLLTTGLAGGSFFFGLDFFRSLFLDFLLRLGRDCLNFRRWRREGNFAFERHGRAADHIVFHVMLDLTILFRGQVSHHVTDVG